MIQPAHLRRFLGLASLLVFSTVACHKEEQAVAGVAQTAVNAEHKAQATASERDQQREQLDKIPLPTKSLYADIHDPAAWANPYLIVGADSIALRTLQPGPAPAGKGSAARRQEQQVAPADLARAIAAVPASAWSYGRVVAVAEAPTAIKKDRPRARRNVEDALKQLNDLGIVVEEWPGR